MNPLRVSRRHALVRAAVLTALPGMRGEQAGDPGATRRAANRWNDLREALFAGRAMERAVDGTGLAVAVPRRAMDPAAVPVTVTLSADLAFRVRTLSLVVEGNPAPLALVAEPYGTGGFRRFSTFLRVEARCFVHAVAEADNGRLLDAASFVEASRGLSGPWNVDFEAARGAMGRMRLALPEGPPASGGRAVPAHLSINHANTSGLGLDERTRTAPSASFLTLIEVRYRGDELLRIETDAAVAADPCFGFTLSGEPGGDLRVDAEDSDGRRFRSGWILGSPG